MYMLHINDIFPNELVEMDWDCLTFKDEEMNLKRSRQQKAKRVMEIANQRMKARLTKIGIKTTSSRDEYVKAIGVDRLVRAWDLASIIA